MHQFNSPLIISYETHKFIATRFRIPIPKGWNGVINADPEILLQRGYDKVVLVQRDFVEWALAMAQTHRQCDTMADCVKLGIIEPRFFVKCKKKYDLLDKEILDPRFFKMTLSDWNNFTFQTYNKLLDFLEFPKENRVLVVPVKFSNERRNFEGYSCSHLPKEHEMCGTVQRIRELGVKNV